ncbi:MAG TPA: serine/threonine-protein kinase [Anaerolineaceae bacterium]
MTTEMLQIGDQFDRFQIQGHIAHGGMSDIYRAYDVVNRREVALKIPDPTMIGDPAQYERFQREKEILQTLEHPAVLRGLGCGQYNRVPYLAMELVDGQSLRDYITQHAPLQPGEALPLFLKIADGMAYVHEQGVVHRDLKPENILLDTEGHPVIMDFGLALTRSAHRVTYANLSATMGTPEYMAPEQVEGKRGDERTDVYALGVMLYEMLAGRAPFSGDSPLAVMAQHVQMPAPRLERDCPGVDPHLAAVVAKALQRDPGARFPTVRVMIQAIQDPGSAAGLDLSGGDAPDTGREPWYRSIYFRGVAVALLLMVAMVILALALQSIRH